MGRGAAGTDAGAAGRGQGPSRRRHFGRPQRWDDSAIEDALAELVAGRESFPTRREFEAAGRADLWDAIRRRGGIAVWAARAGKPLSEAQRPGLSEAQAVAQARQVIAEHGRLPNTTQLRKLGLPKLASYVAARGGSRRFVSEHGLAEADAER